MTGFDPLASDSPLIVYIDYKSPYAFVAAEPTFELEDELGIEADWRPLTLDIPSYLGSARLDERGNVVEQNRTGDQWAAVKYAYRDARRYAALRGLTLRGTVKIWDTSIAHIGMMWAKRQGRPILRAYTRGIYPPFWRRELDAEDPEVIASVLARAGADVAGFESFLAGEGRAEHDAMQAAIFDAGIFGVPSYVVGGELFFGREHLPMVRWLLSGRSGPPPDIAYGHSQAAGGVLVTAGAPSPSLPGRSRSELASPSRASQGSGGTDLASPAPLVVAIDFKQPQSYLAHAPTRDLAASLGIAIDWRPFAVPALEPPAAEPADDSRGESPGARPAARTERHLRFRARYVEHDLHRYAAAQGLVLRDLDSSPDSSLAGVGLFFLREAVTMKAVDRGAVDAYVERVFTGYWSGELDIEDVGAIRRVLAEVGAAAAAFDPDALRDDYDRCLTGLRESGVIAAPAYLVGDELFLGRAHLPMIRR
ncbi:MAG TPA: DsbA family protein, partial [Thermoanaerobaculia bacterium]|nr:DsbA family protein [Thermoanaerobaculia bacterium]